MLRESIVCGRSLKEGRDDLVPSFWTRSMRIEASGKGSWMPRSDAPEFRRRVVELVRSGRSVAVVAAEIGVSEATVYRWRAQDRIDRGECPGLSSVERSELAQARRRIRELETELEITRRASALFSAGEICPKGNTR